MGRGLDGYFFVAPACNRRVMLDCFAPAVFKARRRALAISGGYCVGETPLPIPNRAVKPHSADGTWPARAWESRSPPGPSIEEPPAEAALRRSDGPHHSPPAPDPVVGGVRRAVRGHKRRPGGRALP